MYKWMNEFYLIINTIILARTYLFDKFPPFLFYVF